MQTIASQPVADWFGDWVPNIRTGVDARVTEITKAKALPILVAYDIPYRESRRLTGDPGGNTGIRG
jgi:hypothetical protein